MNCSICNNRIQETFLQKIKGTYIKHEGKLNPICFECQQKFKNKKEDLIAHL